MGGLVGNIHTAVLLYIVGGWEGGSIARWMGGWVGGSAMGVDGRG